MLIFSMAPRAQGNSAQKHRRDTFVPEVLNQIPAKEAGDYPELKELKNRTFTPVDGLPARSMERKLPHGFARNFLGPGATLQQQPLA